MSDETRAGEGGAEARARALSPGLAVGSEFAGHRIEGELGRGGMGVVYRARHLALDAPRALKVIAPGLSADPMFRERFRRESRLAASIDHPNVITVHHAGEEGGLLYISMRLVDGRDLREIIGDEGPLDVDRTAHVIRALGAGLDAAHETGLVHRDVKPANVLVDSSSSEERIFLTDFGISRVSGGGSTVTSSGELLGSVDYVAPEQVEGGEVGPWTDIYSLGCVAYFALTGGPPFVREGDLARLYAHANAPRPRPSEARGGLSSSVDAVVGRAMAISPDDRYDRAEQMAGDFERALRKADANEAPTKPIAVKKPRRRGFRVVRLLAGVLLLAAVAAAAIVVATRGGSNDDSKDSGAAKVAATINVGGRPAGVAVGKIATWVASNDRISSIDLGADKVDLKIPVNGRPVSVVVAYEAIWVVDREHGTVIRYEPRKDKKPVAIATGNGPSDVVAAFGSIWVSNEQDDTVTRIDPATNKVTSQVHVGSTPRSLAAGGGAIWVADFGDGLVSKINPAGNSIDSKAVDIGGTPNDLDYGEGKLWVCDVLTGNVYKVDPNSLEVVGDPISVGDRPRGIKVGFGSVWVANGADDTVTRIDVATGEVVGNPIAVGDDPADIAVGGGSVWTANSGTAKDANASVSRIDPSG